MRDRHASHETAGIAGDRRARAPARHALSRACNAHLDRARAIAIALVAAIVLVARPAGAARNEVRVLVPERTNLQLLALWVAEGAGFFARERLDARVIAPPSPALAQEAFTRGAAPLAVLPAPMILRLASEHQPIVVVANLLANDPIDLVAPRAIADAHGLSRDRPLADRLRAMDGLRIGVAPGPQPRLRALFASQGVPLDESRVVTVPGGEQNAALAEGKVDALYAHTPFLERAILEQGAVVVVDQAGGEVPALSGRVIHALVARAGFARQHPQTVAAAVRAIARAEALIHADPTKAVDAIVRAIPGLDRAHVAELVSLYARAVPESPAPSGDALAKEIAFTPENAAKPDVSAKDVAAIVDAKYAAMPAPAPGGAPFGIARVVVLVALALGLLAAFAAALGESAKSAGSAARDTSV